MIRYVLWLYTAGVAVLSHFYSGLNLNQDKATKPKTVQIVRQGEATPYWFKFNSLYFSPLYFSGGLGRLKAEYGRVICFPNRFD